MLDMDTMRAAFEDELEKIAGSLTGHVRSGRRPIGAQKLMEKDSEHTKVSDIIKVSGLAGAATLMAGGAGLYHWGRKANEDRKLGRQMRLQSMGQQF